VQQQTQQLGPAQTTPQGGTPGAASTGGTSPTGPSGNDL
jgi:hypothetical protein